MDNLYLPYPSGLKVVIVGRNKDTGNYEKALNEMGVSCMTTMDIGRLSEYDALLLPGGGDITPAFFGQKNQGSANIDIELDITQLQSLDLFVKWKRPVIGICKGLQIINVYFGGTITQDLQEAAHHAWNGNDRIHLTGALPHSFLAKLYGEGFFTNSAHHQGVDKMGHGLQVIQHSDDNIIEGIIHDTLPIIGVQWHPERLFQTADEQTVNGRILFSYFLSLCNPAGI